MLANVARGNGRCPRTTVWTLTRTHLGTGPWTYPRTGSGCSTSANRWRMLECKCVCAEAREISQGFAIINFTHTHSLSLSLLKCSLLAFSEVTDE